MNAATRLNSRGNILVVDDTPANLRLLAEILSKQGYQVRPVPSGKLALSAAQGMPPDLVLLDIMMPEMDGYQVCASLKADERTSNIPVIFISAIDDVLDKVKAFDVGGVDYITKPFQTEEVLARVDTHLQIRRLQETLKRQNQELANTIETLHATQDQLVQSEKMAALGQLIAGIAHEINTPLGAIRSSIENIAVFMREHLQLLPQFFQSLPEARTQEFFSLLQASQKQMLLTSKEKRQYKRQLIIELENQRISNAETIADTLVDIGIYDNLQPYFSLLQDPQRDEIINTAYQLASVQKSSQTIFTATERAAKIVFALRTYARYDMKGEKVIANIQDGLETILTLYNNQIKQGIEVFRNYADLPAILCFPDELNQVWTNLIHNAIQAMDYKGILHIETEQRDNFAVVTIKDNGKGIAPEIMPRIFEPFFTTKPAGEGSGLGLDIVRKIIEKHGGSISVESAPGNTKFTVAIPLS